MRGFAVCDGNLGVTDSRRSHTGAVRPETERERKREEEREGGSERRVIPVSTQIFVGYV